MSIVFEGMSVMGDLFVEAKFGRSVHAECGIASGPAKHIE
jgi:hypothetical protein